MFVERLKEAYAAIGREPDPAEVFYMETDIPCENPDCPGDCMDIRREFLLDMIGDHVQMITALRVKMAKVQAGEPVTIAVVAPVETTVPIV